MFRASKWSLAALLTLVMVSMLALGCEGNKTETVDDEAEKIVTKDTITELPGLSINSTQNYVDVDAVVVLEEGILELAATTEKGKTHESVLGIKVPAQSVHLALLLAGLEPGEPGKYIFKEDGEYEVVAPTGDKVDVFMVVDGKEMPISDYIVSIEGDKPLPNNTFVFAGSKFSPANNGKMVYSANASGNVISMVSFGDETLAWPAPATAENDDLLWQIKKGSLPKVGTEVKLRLKKK